MSKKYKKMGVNSLSPLDKSDRKLDKFGGFIADVFIK